MSGLAFDFSKASDEQVLHQVIMDFETADKARATREDKWLTWYKMYRSYVDNKITDRANLFIPYVYSIVETVTPRLIASIFASKPYIGILPVKAEMVENAKAMENLIDYQLNQKVGIISVTTSWIKEALIFGTSILKTGWEYEEDEVITEEPLVQIMGIPIGTRQVKRIEAVKDDPLVQHIDLWDFYVDPAGIDIDSADYCIHKVYRDISYLKEMEKLGVYRNIEEVTKAVSEQAYATGMNTRLSAIGMQSIDKPTDKIELLEYWTDDRVVVVANRAVVIRNDENPYYHRKKPFVRLVDNLVPHEFYGIGEIEPIEYLQYELNSIRNQRMDNINLIINRMWKVLRGADIDPKQLRSRAGGIIEVDDMEDIQALEMENVSASSYQEDEIIRRDMDNATGVNNYARGENTDRRETATTASILSQNANERFKLKVTLMEDMGMRRLGNFLVQLNQQFVDTEKAIRILGPDGMKYMEISPEQIRGQFDVMALGSSVEPTVNKRQKLDGYINLYNLLKDSPYINHPELIRDILETADIKDVDRILMGADEVMMQQLFGQMNMETMGQSMAGPMNAEMMQQGQMIPSNINDEGVMINNG